LIVVLFGRKRDSIVYTESVAREGRSISELENNPQERDTQPK
jgi:hypothetical protein